MLIGVVAASIIARLALPAHALVLEQRAVRLGQYLTGIAKAIDDRIAPVAAEIPQRHLHARRRLAALVFGKVEHARDPRHCLLVEARIDDRRNGLLALDQPLEDRVERI